MLKTEIIRKTKKNNDYFHVSVPPWTCARPTENSTDQGTDAACEVHNTRSGEVRVAHAREKACSDELGGLLGPLKGLIGGLKPFKKAFKKLLMGV